MFHSNPSTQSVALNNEELQRIAPSIFASQPVADVSERYSFLPTGSILEGNAQSRLVACSRRGAEGPHPNEARFSETSDPFRTGGEPELGEERSPTGNRASKQS